MEVEVKLRLPDAAAHQRLSDALAPYHIRTHLQENLFFDGAAGQLSSRLAVLRIRFYDGDSRCVLSLKARARVAGGVSRVEEDEEEIDPSLGRVCAAEPWRLAVLAGSSRIMGRIKDEFGLGGETVVESEERSPFVCLGGFRNVRAVYGWKEGLKLELDETQYDFGTSYEVECETADPERAKALLEDFLKENGIPYSYSEASKFAVFRAGKLLP
uniref:Triphosphate tunnel metalloenzyme 3 n=1 Tax=Elaeis guineensis var. tenera TaxID=51953 RepID=A0A6I9RLK6_ELAGV|nr:triphosphate tunnel metalloenzyme 3 [Elaeis guineensis]XP_010928290.1 triphosphate tunnel metalloenzyme 3 [Elaeis guineensis]XP_010928291.1 triphosphate tunnel metalloenzyme 3 [Elaeis guineensis]XP_010928292.1 triphosphate tunnel metalloenzyme 3 [Elaeis guineensis]XP_010928293.1 triphosphate tunnel metalloenzyme 3 [Elaeis guineensis]XP_029121949.1 triphosphate tunnel metalloenzyme 3 [Elaeis guineensis]